MRNLILPSCVVCCHLYYQKQAPTMKKLFTARRSRFPQLFPLIAFLLFAQLSNGETWSVVNSGTVNDIVGVTWDDVRFIAVDSEGGVLESTDGKTWARKQVEDQYFGSPTFYEIVAGGGRYFALDLNGYVFESTARNSWIERYTGQNEEEFDAETVNGGVYSNGSFVFVGDRGTIVKTTDGLNWTQITSSPTDSTLNRITFGNGLYVAGGDDGLFTSSNAISWIPRKAGDLSPIADVAFFGNRFLAVSSFEVITSTNGTSWNAFDFDLLHGSPYANAVCGGNAGFKIVCDDGKAFSTRNGIDCKPINLNTTSNINDVTYGGGIYVAVGDRGLIRTYKSPPPAPEIAIQQPKGVNLNDGTAKKSFGMVKIGGKSAVKTFTIKNLGTAKLTDLAITKNGEQAKDFIVTAPLKTTLAAGASTTFNVTFKPSAISTRNAAIHIKSNDSNESPFDIKLTGTGVK